MTRLTSTTRFRKPALLAFCIAAALSAPAFAENSTATGTAAAANASNPNNSAANNPAPNDNAATGASVQNAQNLSTVHVTGIAAHSGVDFERGHSAIVELAKLIQTISSFTDLSTGRTINCGVISGGTRSNVIAQSACTEVDVRIARASDAARVEKFFRSLKPSDPHCKLEITGGINRPPMERKSGTIALFRQAHKLAADLGFDLPEASTGGGSDGNFTAALGIPTLDGMGAVGEGAHAAHEHVVIEQLIPRTALLAAMLTTIA